MSFTLRIYPTSLFGGTTLLQSQNMTLHGELNPFCPSSISVYLHELELLGSLACSCCRILPMIPQQYGRLNKTRTGTTPIDRLYGREKSHRATDKNYGQLRNNAAGDRNNPPQGWALTGYPIPNGQPKTHRHTSKTEQIEQKQYQLRKAWPWLWEEEQTSICQGFFTYPCFVPVR